MSVTNLQIPLLVFLQMQFITNIYQVSVTIS